MPLPYGLPCLMRRIGAWLLNRTDSPWYPTVRLFRQPQTAAWPAVFESMAVELKKLVSRYGSGLSPLLAPIAPGELLDRISILTIKSERIKDPEKLTHVRRELSALQVVRYGQIDDSSELSTLAASLRAINEDLWEVEDQLRLGESKGEFGAAFIDLARSVYRHNDKRSDLKRSINVLLRAPFADQKSYAKIVEDVPLFRANDEHQAHVGE